MTTNSARDGAGAFDLILYENGTPVFTGTAEELIEALHELRRHLCKCGHWMREHIFRSSGGWCRYNEFLRDSPCKCDTFTPEESE